ncbi:unnamed protein product [Gadus morhua 'NCC']
MENVESKSFRKPLPPLLQRPSVAVGPGSANRRLRCGPRAELRAQPLQSACRQGVEGYHLITAGSPMGRGDWGESAYITGP